MGSTSPSSSTSSTPPNKPALTASVASQAPRETVVASTTSTETPAATESELRELLKLRQLEIQMLKFELERYKLALRQSQLDYQNFTRQQSRRSSSKEDNVADDNIDTNPLETVARRDTRNSSHLDGADTPVTSSERIDGEGELANVAQVDVENILVVEPSSQDESKKLCRQSTTSSASASRIVFMADEGDDDNDDDDDEMEGINLKDESNDNLEDIIHDVGEIDLELELQAADSNKQQKEKGVLLSEKSSGRIQHGGSGTVENDQDHEDDDEDIISDGLLTSLTDAAISNLSQLAALQERCESQQQQHSNQYQQPSHHHQQQQPPQQQQQRHSNSGLLASRSSSIGCGGSDTQANSPPLRPICMNQPHNNEFPHHDPYTASAIASQAAIAINAAAGIQSNSSMIAIPQHPVSVTSSMSPNSNLQADLNSSHSLARVVAAAAVAAAAANDQQQHQSHHSQLNQQTRLISSALPSPEFYHSLQQHHSHAQSMRQQQHSPVSSLHFSPSTSITPSPSSLMAQSRHSVSNTSSSIMSPISSPNYLRRQFMPDRLPLMSPSPTSGLTTGSSSGASSSLAHILHQRSASALGGGPLTSSSGTPLSSGGSTAVSPLISNKNSTQARLNNMQIRHKFGFLGSGRAQFNSPHGFCLGLNQEIVVADTNNHRVCIFDKSGTYLTQFGSPGKEEGQLWNPRKVAILHRPNNGHQVNSSNASTSSAAHQLQQSHHHHHNQTATSTYSGHINNLQSSGQLLGCNEPLYVVCDRGAERSRMQLFTKDGAFIKKIGIHYIDIVAGLAITQNGLIIVVDSVSPTVYIINGETGILNGWFDCSGHMKEPSDIAVKSDVPGNEYFICDFKGHCVVVFSEQGEYLRKIGHDGLTSYPNGIDISDDGDILVGDSHGNRFHVVVFDRNGEYTQINPPSLIAKIIN